MIENILTDLSKGDYLQRAYELQAAMLDIDPDLHVELEPDHYFADGMYLRSLFIEEGVACVGHVHRYAHFTILAQGKSTIISQEGRLDVEAPYIFISSPFAKRSVYATTDCTWITVHKNTDNETDVDTLENEHLIMDVQELIEMRK